MALNSALDEERVIDRYFRKSQRGSQIDLGIGDDAAIINLSGQRLAITTDTLVEAVHFEADADAGNLGYKALAVNLSDLAAMGARPRWALIALTMPNADADWLQAFSDGFFQLANRHRVSLIGGDTTRGRLTISVQLIGTLDETHTLRRDAAQVGEGIYLTGRIAETALAALFADHLKDYPESYKQCMARMQRPVARVAEGLLLARYATAAIDISDGIFKDLTRVLSASGVGAEVEIEDLPMAVALDRFCPTLELLIKSLSFGEDYELLFTLKDDHIDTLKEEFSVLGTAVTRIGTIDRTHGLRCRWQSKLIKLPRQLGYDHFASVAS